MEYQRSCKGSPGQVEELEELERLMRAVFGYGSERYSHLPLPTPTSIRLLEILPASQNRHGTVQCNITVVDLNDSPTYCALSYTWGNPLTVYPAGERIPSAEEAAELKFSVVCNDYSFKVTENCYRAIRSVQPWTQMLEEKKLQIFGAYTLGGSPKPFFDSGETRYIWIDAICINQLDTPELSAQVSIMNRIYRQARAVIIYLGPEDSFSQDAMINLSHLAKIPAKMVETTYGASMQDPESYSRLGIPYINGQQWASIYAFLNRTWFTRAWIVQEVAWARKALIVCGSLSIDWLCIVQMGLVLEKTGWAAQLAARFSNFDSDDLANQLKKELSDSSYFRSESHRRLRMNPYMSLYVDLLRHNLLPKGKKSEDIPIRTIQRTHFNVEYGPHLPAIVLSDLRAIIGNAVDMEPLPAGRPPRPSLQAILHANRHMRCSREEDRVYAFLGIAAQSSGAEVPINYSQPIQRTYVQVAWGMIKSSCSLRVLSFVEDKGFTNIKGLPSWTPDFSADRTSVPFDNGVDSGFAGISPCVFNAANGTQWKSQLQSPSHDHLIVEGIYCDSIDLLSEFKMHSLQRILPLLDAFSENCYDLLWRTLIADKYHSEYPAPATYGTVVSEMIQTWLDILHASMLIKGRRLPEGATDFHRWDERFRGYQSAARRLSGMGLEIDDLFDDHEEVRDSLVSITSAAANGTIYYGPESDPLLPYKILERRLVRVMKWRAGGGFGTPAFYELQTQIQGVQFARHLFITANKRLGCGPKSARPGDEVWILAGGRVPYILRPAGDQEYELVGEAYVHGIMHGEVVKTARGQFRRITLK